MIQELEHKEQQFQQMKQMVEQQSVYKRKQPQKKTTMTAAEMGKLLGLKKTDRYWLIHKNYFKTEMILGEMRVDLESFEKWYANQVKYRKVTGEEPGKELKERSFSPQEIAEMLGVTDGVVYDLIKNNSMETIIVDYWKRVPKDVFWKWYNNQNRYRTKEDREKDAAVEEATISMPEMARALGISRSNVYSILADNRYKHFFEVLVVADRKRITKESFEAFLNGQDKYRLCSRAYKGLSIEEKSGFADYQRRQMVQNENSQKSGSRPYLTLDEAASMAKVSRTRVLQWHEDRRFPVVKVDRFIRIYRQPYENWLQIRKQEKERQENGIH